MEAFDPIAFEKNLAAAIDDMIAHRRKYASGFHAYPKGLMERKAAERFAKGARAAGFLQLTNFRNYKPDPPDCVALDENGRIVGIEVTELVSSEAVRLNAIGRNVFANWTDAEWLAEIAQKIREKDTGFDGGPYVRRILVVYTAEHMLTADKCQQLVVGQKFTRPRHLTDAFLMAEPLLRLNMPPEPVDAVFRLEFS